MPIARAQDVYRSHPCRLFDATAPRLLAISDLHVGYPENREITENLRPESAGDWLLVAGDVGELIADITWALRHADAAVCQGRVGAGQP